MTREELSEPSSSWAPCYGRGPGRILGSRARLPDRGERLTPARDTARAMSQENVETVLRAYEAFNRGDLDAASEVFHPEIQWSGPGVRG